MNEYKQVPIKMGRAIAEAYNQDQVVIVCFNKEHSKTSVTTYGKTVEDCDQAALGGNMVKRALGWPEEHCQAKVTPRRKRGKPKA